MAENYTVAPVTTFTNDTTAVNTVNNNLTAISTAFTDTLSRSGVSPNQMNSALDMNSNQILNLPAPGTINSPARLVDVTSTNPINISLSLTGDVTAPASSGILTTTLSSTGLGKARFGALNVVDFGADPTGVADSAAAINNTILALPVTGGDVYFPAGTYKITSPIVLGNGSNGVASTRSGVRLLGIGMPGSTNSNNGYTTIPNVKIIAATISMNMVIVQGPLQGWGIQNIVFDHNNLTGVTAIQVISAEQGEVRNVGAIHNNNGVGIQSTTWSSMPGGFTSINSMHNLYQNIVLDVSTSATFAYGIQCLGASNAIADTAYCVFDNITVSMPSAGVGTYIPIYCALCDNNIFRNIHSFGGGASTTALQFDYTVNNAFPSSNIFYGIDLKSNSLVTQAANIGTPGAGATSNQIHGLLLANGATAPNIPNLTVYAGNGSFTLSPGGNTANTIFPATPNVQRFTSGTANYTPSANTHHIKVTMVGGGGGGGAQATNNGGNATASLFGGWTAVAGSGGNAAGGVGGSGGSGGANGTGTLIARFSGGSGGPGISNSAGETATGGTGGINPFAGNVYSASNSAGANAQANTGAGGQGAGSSGATATGGGGGAGEYVQFYVTNPGVTSYTVGTGGTGGAAGVLAGGNGAAGIIIIEEFAY